MAGIAAVLPWSPEHLRPSGTLSRTSGDFVKNENLIIAVNTILFMH